MRYPAAEKLEVIRLVEGSHLPVRRTLRHLGVPPATFYRWYERFQAGGPEALADRPSRPDRVWNRIPDAVRGRIIDLALAEPELSPRELAVRFTDRERYFVSEASVYRLLADHDLVTSPAFVVVKAADEFHTKTTGPNQLWQADFTYLEVAGWGWFYLSTVLDDFSRYVIAWKLCATMAASDVTETLELALAASGCTQARVWHRPRLLSDNGPGYISGELAAWLAGEGMEHIRGAQEPHPAREPPPARRTRGAGRGLHRALQPPARPREPGEPHPGRRLLRPRPGDPARAGAHQAPDHPATPLAAPQPGHLTSQPR
jgi:putative transposase